MQLKKGVSKESDEAEKVQQWESRRRRTWPFLGYIFVIEISKFRNLGELIVLTGHYQPIPACKVRLEITNPSAAKNSMK